MLTRSVLVGVVMKVSLPTQHALQPSPLTAISTFKIGLLYPEADVIFS